MKPAYIFFSQPVKKIPTHSPKLPIVAPFMMKSLFTDNSLVCYKPHSLAPGGVRTVRNAGVKENRT
jgi:hypothetical protein